LPYGFGPGSRTIIEDAGDIDDDEEDYGEYQVINNENKRNVLKQQLKCTEKIH